MKKLRYILSSLLILIFVVSVEGQETQSLLYHHSVKINYGLSWGFGGPILTYEHFLKPQHSHEYGLGMCFPNRNYTNRPNEISISAGHKFMAKSRYGKALQGFYVKPSVFLTYSWLTLPVFDHNEGWEIITTKHTESSLVAAVIPKCGYQLVTRHGFTLDYYLGIGVWFSNSEMENVYQVAFAAMPSLSGKVGVALINGFNLGWAF